MIKNVLITGGAGSVGQFVAEELQEKYQVTLFDQVHPQDQAQHPWETKLPFVIGDLTVFGDCVRAVSASQADAIIHLGGIRWSPEQWPTQQKAPEDIAMRVNGMGTYYLMDAARRFDVQRVVMASTFYVLGLGNRISDAPFAVEYLPIDEEHPLRPEDTYSLSKVLGEEILQAFTRAYGIQTTALRLGWVDSETGRDLPGGPGSKSPYPLKPRPDHVGGPKGNTAQYVDIRDVALGCRLALEAEGLEGFEPFYLFTDTLHEEDTREVVEKLYPDLKEMAANLKGKEGMISIERARKKLGYEPQHSWRKK